MSHEQDSDPGKNLGREKIAEGVAKDRSGIHFMYEVSKTNEMLKMNKKEESG